MIVKNLNFTTHFYKQNNIKCNLKSYKETFSLIHISLKKELSFII